MRVQELSEKRVEIVGRGRKIEERWVIEYFIDLGVELGHSGDGLGFLDYEGVVQNADGIRGLRDLHGIVYVRQACPTSLSREEGGAR